MTKRCLFALVTVALLTLGTPAHAAYSGVCTLTASWTYGGVKHYWFSVVESEARDTSEFNCAGAPKIGTIFSYHGNKISGTGTTLSPIIGETTGFLTATMNWIATAETPGADVYEQTETSYADADGVLYFRNTVNDTTADHVIHTEILIREGS